MQCATVGAIALTGWCGSIIKYVTNVPMAATTHNLSAHHAMRLIYTGNNAAVIERLVEARPSAAAFKLPVRLKQRVTASRTVISARGVVVQVLSCTWRNFCDRYG